MVVSCSACGEQYGVTEDVTFHKFPANEERREKWLAAVQREEWTPAKRSMLCSKHFSPDKFVYKISGDKIRRYLMPDTVPTIFDRTKRKSRNGPRPRLGMINKAPCSGVKASATPIPVNLEAIQSQNQETPLNNETDSTCSLNLEILAATSVALEPYLIATNSESIKLEKGDAEIVSESVETQAEGVLPVTCSSSSSVGRKSQNREKRLSNLPSSNKRNYCGIRIQTDLTSSLKNPRQVYPGDFKQMNYNDVLEVSKSWTVQNNYIMKMRNNMKALRQRNRRLEKRVTDLKSVVKFLKNRLVARDSAAVQLCGFSDCPATIDLVTEDDQLRQLPNPLRDHDYFCVKENSAS